MADDSGTRYERPTNPTRLSPDEKAELLQTYFRHCEQVARQAPEQLNVKMSREAFAEVLDELGGLLLERSRELAAAPGPVRDFLDDTELPACLRDTLPDDFRAFCLVLNALKQWVSAESAATDRYLLGGTARKQCRAMADHCLVTGESLEGKKVELHHPVRDGRPPIPLSKAGHERIEQSSNSRTDDPAERTLRQLKKHGNRSWVMLRRGCESLLGNDDGAATPAVLASSRTFARAASQETGLQYDELIEWLDERGLA